MQWKTSSKLLKAMGSDSITLFSNTNIYHQILLYLIEQ